MAKEQKGQGSEGSLAGSTEVKKQRTGPRYTQEHDWGGLGREGNGGNSSSGKGEPHAQPKAERIAPLNESDEGAKDYE